MVNYKLTFHVELGVLGILCTYGIARHAFVLALIRRVGLDDLQRSWKSKRKKLHEYWNSE